MDVNIPTEVLRSYVAIADTGSFTQAAERVFRTQSAISQQVNKLEQTVGKELFVRDGRKIKLTTDGDAFLGYARRILKLHDEAVSAITEPDLEGHIKFGIPDDYAIKYLPPILSSYTAAYPKVDLEVYCRPSTELLKMKGREAPDISVISQGPNRPIDEVVRSERTIWATSAKHFVHERDPLPVALYEPGCVVRQSVLEALDKHGRAYRMVYSSASHTGLIAAVESGIAVTAIAKSTLPDSLRILGPEDGFPTLPSFDIGIMRKEKGRSNVAESLAQHISHCFREGLIPE